MPRKLVSLLNSCLLAPGAQPDQQASLWRNGKRCVWIGGMSLILVALVMVFTSKTPGINETVNGQTACPQFSAAAITHGFVTSATLPDGDHFLLADPFALTVTAPVGTGGTAPGVSIFNVTPASFGGTVVAIGGFAGTNPTGVSFSTPNGSLRAVACLDSLWDLGFVLASSGATIGDRVVFSVQNQRGALIDIAVFTFEAGGARVTSLHPNVVLFRNNRLANGPGRLFAGDLIPFASSAGAAGNRTDLLVLAFDPDPNSPLNFCSQLVTSITRGANAGTVSMVITDVVVKRMEVRGDRARPEAGLIGGLTGGYPTGLVCPVACPVCLQPPTIACPSDQTACAAAGSTTTVVNYPAPTATGATATCTPASGSSFPVGATRVTCTATNAAGSATCSFTVTVTATPTITCPANITTPATSSAGFAVVNYPAPTATAGTTVTCVPASGSTFLLGTTTVTCRATNACGTASCSFTVTVLPIKCDTVCFRSAQFWLLNLDRLPDGAVQIAGANSNQFISTRDVSAIRLALQGNPFGFGLSPQQRFNQQYVAAQLNFLLAGGGGSPTFYNAQWANLSCYGIRFADVTLSNGVTLSINSMVKELFMFANQAASGNRAQDYAPLANVFSLLNGNDPLGSCN
jgi:hypothetical protein